MDIKDLMIGDWVYSKHHEKNIQIKPYDFFVHCHCNSGSVAVLSTIVSGKDFEPIPLTEDILVKNGWFALDEYRYEGDIALAKESSGFRLKNTNICVNSVHELQHLLRLCGASKEIEL